MGLVSIGNLIFDYYFNDANLHYYQVFTMFWASTLSLFLGAFLLITLSIRLTHYVIVRKCLPQNLKISLTDPNATLLEETQKKEKKPLKALLKIMDIIFKVGLIVCLFVLTLIPIAFSAFGEIHDYWAIIICIMIYSSAILLWIKFAISSKKDKVEEESQLPLPSINFGQKIKLSIKRHPYVLGTMAFFSLLFSISSPLLTSATCQNFYNKNYGFQFVGISSLSSRFLRKFTIDTVCPPGKPCHVYATLPEDASTQVFLNIHVNAAVNNLTVNYDTVANFQNSGKLQFSTNQTFMTYYDFNGEEQGARNVHVALLTGLTPATTYQIQIVYDNTVQYNSTYRTLPDDPNSPVTIAIGGDVGSEDIAQQVTAGLYDYNPDVAIVGGDVAYDNALETCWYSWDEFFWMFETLGNRLGKILPIVAGVGNHDVGFDAGGPLFIDKANPPHYIKFMPQHLKPATPDAVGNEWLNEVPDFSERRTYFDHKIGGSVFISLDSAYNLDYSGVQVDFMNNISQQNPDAIKIAYYHVPTFPCCVNLDDTSQTTHNEAMITWNPIFEQQKFLAVFENHVHRWKKTFSLLNGTVVDRDQGVTYFGDGNWGTVASGCKTTELSNATGILEVSKETNHVWIVRLNSSQYEVFPVNSTGQQFYKSWTGNLNRSLDYVSTPSTIIDKELLADEL